MIEFDYEFEKATFCSKSEVLKEQFAKKLKRIFYNDVDVKFYKLDHSSNLKIYPKPNSFYIVIDGYFQDTYVTGFEKELKKLGIGAQDYPIITPICDDNENPQFLFIKEGIPLAGFDINHKTIYLFFNYSYLNITRSKKVLNLILEILLYYRDMFDGQFGFMPINSDENIINNSNLNNKIPGQFIKKINKREIDNIKSNLVNVLDNIEYYSKQLKQANLRRNQLNDSLNALDSKLYNDIILTNDYVYDVKFKDDEIEVYTKDIFVDDYDVDKYNYLISDGNPHYKGRKKIGDIKPKFYIGKFIISIKLSNMEISFININNVRNSYWGSECNHPHVDESGRGCLGDLTELVAYCMSNSDIDTLVSLCIQYLQSANLNDVAGRYLAEWDAVYEKDGKLYLFESDEIYNNLDKSNKVPETLEEIIFN